MIPVNNNFLMGRNQIYAKLSQFPLFTKFCLIKFHNLNDNGYFCNKNKTRIMDKGIKNTIETIVTEEKTALSMGSGTLRVYATPAMIALIEETAWRSVKPYLEEGQGTVGTSVTVKHLAPTPLNMKVWCETELVEVDGRRLVFEAKVHDESGIIGSGTHERFVITEEKFQKKADGKFKMKNEE